jgi:hypothetical protein
VSINVECFIHVRGKDFGVGGRGGVEALAGSPLYNCHVFVG